MVPYADLVTRIDRGRRRRPLLVAGALLVAVAAALMTTYGVIGSHVDADGTLREPFALIPLAWLSGVAGVVAILR